MDKASGPERIPVRMPMLVFRSQIPRELHKSKLGYVEGQENYHFLEGHWLITEYLFWTSQPVSTISYCFYHYHDNQLLDWWTNQWINWQINKSNNQRNKQPLQKIIALYGYEYQLVTE